MRLSPSAQVVLYSTTVPIDARFAPEMVGATCGRSADDVPMTLNGAGLVEVHDGAHG